MHNRCLKSAFHSCTPGKSRQVINQIIKNVLDLLSLLKHFLKFAILQSDQTLNHKVKKVFLVEITLLLTLHARRTPFNYVSRIFVILRHYITLMSWSVPPARTSATWGWAPSWFPSACPSGAPTSSSWTSACPTDVTRDAALAPSTTWVPWHSTEFPFSNVPVRDERQFLFALLVSLSKTLHGINLNPLHDYHLVSHDDTLPRFTVMPVSSKFY